MPSLMARQSDDGQWWHVYETRTTPWGLITAFRTREEAEFFAAHPLSYGILALEIGPRSITVLQEEFRCTEEGCSTILRPGTKAFIRSLFAIRRTAFKKEERVLGRYLASCLGHIPNRFDRDELV